MAHGLSVSDLRWLVTKGFVEHGNEVSVPGDPQRSFDVNPGLHFEDKTCLVLTAEGAAFCIATEAEFRAQGSGSETAGGEASFQEPAEEGPYLLAPALTPRWDAGRRELHLGEVLVKRFRVPAANQEFILAVFEEDGWPEFIDDPLPPAADLDQRTRLREAIKRLNGNQANAILRFRGNGSGEGLCWEVVEKAAEVGRLHGVVAEIGRRSELCRVQLRVYCIAAWACRGRVNAVTAWFPGAHS